MNNLISHILGEEFQFLSEKFEIELNTAKVRPSQEIFLDEIMLSSKHKYELKRYNTGVIEAIIKFPDGSVLYWPGGKWISHVPGQYM